MIARGRPFLVPVGLDETRAEEVGVPDSFQRVQWTRLPGGATPEEFIERIARLLSASQARAPAANAAQAAPSAAPPPAAASASPPLSPPPHDSIPARRSWTRWGVAGAIALVILLGLGYFALGKRHSPAAAVAITAPSKAAAMPAATLASNSIAVLPLQNLSRDPDQQYFSDGLSESLITAFTQIPQLKVIGKSSSFLFRHTKESSHEIGQQLGVAHLLVGSVERFGDQIRVSAELINTSDGYHLVAAVRPGVPESERAALAHDLLAGLDGPPGADAQQAWEAEIANRLDELARRWRRYICRNKDRSGEHGMAVVSLRVFAPQHSWLTIIVLSSVYASMDGRLPSRPSLEALNPPFGAFGRSV
jgi:TolB-like protein